MINRTVADVLPPSARTSAAAVDIYDYNECALFKGTGDAIPESLLSRKVWRAVFPEDNFSVKLFLDRVPIEKEPRPPGTLASYGVDEDN